VSQAGDAEPLRAGEVVAAAAGLATVDPATRWERGLAPPQPQLSRFTPSIALAIERDGGLLGWAAGSDTGRREYFIPGELHADLAERVPQALLRDLDRPGPLPGAVLEPREGAQLLGLWEQGVAEVAAAKVLPRRAQVVPAAEVFLDDQVRRRRFFAEPWQPALDDDAPRRPVDL